MYRSSPLSKYRFAASSYEREFRRVVPQWVEALDRLDAVRLLTVCVRIRWKLPLRLLLVNETYQGKGSLWERSRLASDYLYPDLQNLPIDPAVAATRSFGWKKRP